MTKEGQQRTTKWEVQRRSTILKRGGTTESNRTGESRHNEELPCVRWETERNSTLWESRERTETYRKRKGTKEK